MSEEGVGEDQDRRQRTMSLLAPCSDALSGPEALFCSHYGSSWSSALFFKVMKTTKMNIINKYPSWKMLCPLVKALKVQHMWYIWPTENNTPLKPVKSIFVWAKCLGLGLQNFISILRSISFEWNPCHEEFINLEGIFNFHEKLSLRIINIISTERDCQISSHFTSKKTKT